MEPFKLERHFARYEFKAKFMASSSDAEAMTLSDLLAFDPHAASSLGSTWLGYSESSGIPELRAAIAQTYRNILPEQILAHTGAQEPIFNFFHSCFSQGDHVVVHVPSYQSLTSVPRAIGCEVTPWEARFESGWRLDLEELKRLLRPDTRAVVVNSPHNPTGFCLTPEDQTRLAELLRPRGILLFFDEVYRELEFDPTDRLPAACDVYENAISLGVLSKSYGLPGLRLGWVATRNSEVLEKMAVQKDYTTICNPILSEKLGIIALENRERILGRNREIVKANWALTQKFLERHGNLFEWVPPRGGTLVFPRAKGNFPVERFARFLLDEASVLLVGGEHFDMPGRYFRLGFGRKNFPEILDVLEMQLGRFLQLNPSTP